MTMVTMVTMISLLLEMPRNVTLGAGVQAL